MAFTVQISRIVGDINDKYGSWVHTFTPQDKNKLACRGHFFVVLALKKIHPDADLTNFGKEIIFRLHEAYYSELIFSPFEHLQLTLQTGLIEVKDHFEVEILVASVVNDVFYATGVGSGKIKIYRDGKLTTIFANENAVSGYIKTGDLFCLGTGEFFNQLSEGSLCAGMEAGSVAQIAEALVPLMYGHFGQQSDPKIEGLIGSLIIKTETASIVEKLVSKPLPPSENTDKLRVMTPIKNKLADIFLNLQILWQRIDLPIIKKSQGRKFLYLILTAFFLFILILGINLAGGQKREKQALGNQFDTVLQAAKEKKEEGDSLISLNPGLAKDLLLQSQTLSQQAEQIDSNGNGLADFKTSLQSSLDKVIKEYQFEGKLFFDLSLIKPNASGDDLIVNGDNLLILDKNQAAVYSISIQDKKSNIVVGGDFLKNGLALAGNGQQLWTITSDGVYAKDKKVADYHTQTPKIFVSEFSSAIYLLDSQIDNTGQIWRLSENGNTLGEKQKWLKADINLNSAQSMAIDGSIWVLTADGNIYKLTRGVMDELNISGLTKSINDPRQIYTDSDSDNIYILDSGNSRILVLNKIGQYNCEYLWSEIGSASKMVIREKDKRAFLLIGSKIYEFELK